MERALYTAVYPSYNTAERPTRFIEFIKQVTESYVQYVYLYELEHCKWNITYFFVDLYIWYTHVTL